jgi:hypothetical protein
MPMMQTYEEVVIKLYSFFFSTIVEGQLSAASSRCFTPSESSPVPIWYGGKAGQEILDR